MIPLPERGSVVIGPGLELIGSEHKADIFRARLETRVDAAAAARFEEEVHCPIGIPIASKNPKVIAVSIAAELLKEWQAKPAPARTAA